MSYTLRDKARFIQKVTGYTVKDSLAVLQAAEAFDMYAFRNHKSIKYGRLFTVEPYKIPERNRYDINSGTVLPSKSHYGVRLKLHKAGDEILNEKDE